MDLQRRRRVIAACVSGGVLMAYLMLIREGGVEPAAQPVAAPDNTATADSAVHVFGADAANTTPTTDAGHRERRVTGVTGVTATAPIPAGDLTPRHDADASHHEMRMQRQLPASTEAQPAPVTPAGPGLLAVSDGVVVRQTLGAGSAAAQAPIAPAPAGDVTVDPVSGMAARRSVDVAEGAKDSVPMPAGGTLIATQSGVAVRTALPAESPQ